MVYTIVIDLSSDLSKEFEARSNCRVTVVGVCSSNHVHYADIAGLRVVPWLASIGYPPMTPKQ
jgi:hypothetical protein